VTRTGKSTAPLRKAKQNAHGQPSGNERDQLKRQNGSEQDDGGFKAKVNSGTLEVRFMIEPSKCNTFNQCMRLGEFITESQAMDSSFRIMPLEGEGGEFISAAEDWPNTKDGIGNFNRHWSRLKNVSGKIKIVTNLSLVLHYTVYLSSI
jgi:hypothetical protein